VGGGFEGAVVAGTCAAGRSCEYTDLLRSDVLCGKLWNNLVPRGMLVNLCGVWSSARERRPGAENATGRGE
jgi:hypothetical protein